MNFFLNLLRMVTRFERAKKYITLHVVVCVTCDCLTFMSLVLFAFLKSQLCAEEVTQEKETVKALELEVEATVNEINEII